MLGMQKKNSSLPLSSLCKSFNSAVFDYWKWKWLNKHAIQSLLKIQILK